MKSIIKSLLKRFHKGELTLEQLNMELLIENPYMVNSDHWLHYENWINEAITNYASGQFQLLQINSKGSILNQIDDDIDEDDINGCLDLGDMDIYE